MKHSKLKISVAAALTGAGMLATLAAPSAAMAAVRTSPAVVRTSPAVGRTSPAVVPNGTWYYILVTGTGTSEEAAEYNAVEQITAMHCDVVRLESVYGSGTSWWAQYEGMCYLA